MKSTAAAIFSEMFIHILYIIGLDTDNYDTITLNLHDYPLVTYA